VLEALNIFGIERCMFASNFPVAGLRVDFNTLVRSVARMVSGYSAAQQRAFFVGNAARFYRLELEDAPFAP
ncbi:MAG: amidohydrolase family protein, partial [Rubrivivax sp.]